MLIITAPSKTQQSRHALEKLPSKQFSLPVFFTSSLILNAELAKFSLSELRSLMNMSPALAHSTRERIENFADEITPSTAMQAIYTFQGDAYSSLAPEDYSLHQLQHAQRHLRILSGLYGILRPLDLMFPYRLEMATKLKVDAAANLYQFWGERITENINQDLADLPEPVLINLASTEYSRIIRPKKLQGKMVTITFKEKKGDNYRTVPIYSKKARGMMIHFMITKGLSSSWELRDFTAGGYEFRPQLSTEEEWIFTRD